MAEIHTISSAGRSQSDEVSERTRRYLITMGVRTACFVAACVTRGWVQILCIALTVILPYIAVIAANTAKRRVVQPVNYVDPHQITAPATDQEQQTSPTLDEESPKASDG